VRVCGEAVEDEPWDFGRAAEAVEGGRYRCEVGLRDVSGWGWETGQVGALFSWLCSGGWMGRVGWSSINCVSYCTGRSVANAL
jgi:hypothetical protein